MFSTHLPCVFAHTYKNNAGTRCCWCFSEGELDVPRIRLTNAFSKKFDNHCHAVAIYFACYNFCRVHQTLRVTAAMKAGLTDHIWSLTELLGLLEGAKFAVAAYLGCGIFPMVETGVRLELTVAECSSAALPPWLPGLLAVCYWQRLPRRRSPRLPHFQSPYRA
jgi:hypothetical protein